jgi:hypothetical protein
MNLKTTLLYLTLVCFSFGCDDMYPKKERYVAIDVHNENGMIDSITLHRDTIRVYRSNRIDDSFSNYTISMTIDTIPFAPTEVPIWVGKKPKKITYKIVK